MSWFKATSVTATNGSNIVTIVSGESIASVQPGDALLLGAQDPVEINRAYVDGGSNQLLELVDNWAATTQTTVAGTVLPTAGDFLTATNALKDATTITSNNVAALDAWITQTSGTVAMTNLAGTVFNVKPVQLLESELEVIGSSAQAMTSQDFFALAEKRIRDNAGSGFSEWGRHTSGTTHLINEGMSGNPSETAGYEDEIYLGRPWYTSGVLGGSRTDSPVVGVNGVQLNLSSVSDSNAQGGNRVKLPPAPDGLDKSDGTGVHASLAAAITAGTTALTASVITRQDFVMLEVWHEAIDDKDVVCPLGNVQYGATTWESITLSNVEEVQGYSAFGDWDTTTKGYMVKWSTLSDANKVKFLQDPENNIYSDDGTLVQVRYRVRVIKGLGDTWDNIGTNIGTYLRYSSTLNVYGQGSDTTPIQGTDLGEANSARTFPTFSNGTYPSPDAGVAAARTDGSVNAHNGLCFAVPIALVQRRNQGSYEPTFNPQGSAEFGDSLPWYASTDAMASTSDCFDSVDDGSITGAASGRSDLKFFDAIYASDVQDLRMSSKRLPLSEIREKAKRRGIAGTIRGFEGVPFTRVQRKAATSSNAVSTSFQTDDTSPFTIGDVVSVTDIVGNILIIEATVTAINTNVGIAWDAAEGDFNRVSATEYTCVYTELQTPDSANPTWTDIIGDPVNILATFPNGVEGQWIPVIPDGIVDSFDFNRKLTTNLTSERTTDDGVTWASFTPTVVTTTNLATLTNEPAANVVLLHFETQAHFTEDTAVTEVSGYDSVYATDHNGDSILVSSLVSTVPIGTANQEDLSITKIINGTVSHTAVTLTPDLTVTTAIGHLDGQQYLMYNYDNAGTIDGTLIKTVPLAYFHVEEL